MLPSPCLGFLAAAASCALALTPQGFSPGAAAPLAVIYSLSISAASDGALSQATTAKQPKLATSKALPGRSYAVIMVDMDVPTGNPPKTTTLLHWMQTDLTPSPSETILNTTLGRTPVFLLENRRNVVAAAPYIGPSPPARVPLSHRYTEILIDMSNASMAQITKLSQAALKRESFDTNAVLESVGIAKSQVIAGNFFNVTNPGPAQSGPLPPTPGAPAPGEPAATAAPGAPGNNTPAAPGSGAQPGPPGAAAPSGAPAVPAPAPVPGTPGSPVGAPNPAATVLPPAVAPGTGGGSSAAPIAAGGSRVSTGLVSVVVAVVAALWA
ncbi:hypothetical protein RB595_002848 [Gaeumannomyces hyphopodioides]